MAKKIRLTESELKNFISKSVHYIINEIMDNAPDGTPKSVDTIEIPLPDDGTKPEVIIPDNIGDYIIQGLLNLCRYRHGYLETISKNGLGTYTIEIDMLPKRLGTEWKSEADNNTLCDYAGADIVFTAYAWKESEEVFDSITGWRDYEKFTVEDIERVIFYDDLNQDPHDVTNKCDLEEIKEILENYCEASIEIPLPDYDFDD